MPVPEVVIVATFTTENEPSQGTVVFTDDHFSVDASDSEIYTPVRVTGYLDQNGFMRVRLPLNVGLDTLPQPRMYHCIIGVLEYHAEFDFVINPTQTLIDLATIIPVSPVPTLTASYVASVAGMSGNISAEELATKVGEWSPAAGDSAYETWLRAGNVGTVEDFFNAYRGAQGVPGVEGPAGPQGLQGIPGVPGPAGPQGDDFTIEGVVNDASELPSGYPRYTVFVTTSTQEFWLNIGADQWMTLGTYKGEPGAPGPSITKEELGLENVDNTRDLDKPVSTATQAALDAIDIPEQTDLVTSVNLQTGDVVIDKNDVGLDQVANLAPAALPISTQTQLALDTNKALAQTRLDAKKLTQLADMSSTDTPANGDVPTWVTNHWDYLPSGVQVVAIGSAADLNTYLANGTFTQVSNAAAASGTNYPIALAGMLNVTASPDNAMVWQRYTVYGSSGAVNTDTNSNVVWLRSRYNGIWTLWKPMAWGKPMVWNSTASGWNGVPAFADFLSQDWGGEVYLDSQNRLRSRPQILYANGILSTALPSAWPVGVTVMGVSSAGGYPGSGNVLTVKRETGEWTMQIWSTGPANQQMKFRFGSTSWGAWEMFAGPVYSEATPLVAYSGWKMNSSYMNVHGHTVQLYGNITRTGGTLTSTAGDIPNTSMCYIASGLPYPTTSVGLCFTGGNTLFGGVCGSDRVLTISCVSPGKGIDPGEAITFSAMYLTNTQ